jgi:hypothetical protein
MRQFVVCALVLLELCGSVICVHAHDGPPFPLLVDQKVGQLGVSVWTDPDVGTGSFFIMLEPPPGGSVPSDLQVEVVVQPVSGRLKEASYPAIREDLRGQIQYKALVSFDAEEMWRVRVRLHSTQAGGELLGTVEATPSGLGRWDLLIYLLPFVAVAFLWLVAIKRRVKNPN